MVDWIEELFGVSDLAYSENAWVIDMLRRAAEEIVETRTMIEKLEQRIFELERENEYEAIRRRGDDR